MKIQEPFDIFPLSLFLLLSIFINNTWARTEQNTKRAIKSPSAGAAFEEGLEPAVPGGCDALAKPRPEPSGGPDHVLVPPELEHSPRQPRWRQDWTHAPPPSCILAPPGTRAPPDLFDLKCHYRRLCGVGAAALPACRALA